MINNNYNGKYLLKEIKTEEEKMNLLKKKELKSSLNKEKNFLKITKTNKRNNINNTSCNNYSTSYFGKCNNKCSI